jgi:hypothetical protein
VSDGPPRSFRARTSETLPALLLAALGVMLGFLWVGDRDLNLADEGYLWYGVKRVLAGEFPLRDFQSYDPGRYFWCAAFEPIFGSGILGVRRAAAVFLALGLGAGLVAVRRLGGRTLAWQVALLPLLWLWVFPRHKLFEPAITLVFVLALTRLFERPSRGARILCGVLVGLAGWFGRNHALYGTLAVFLALLLQAWKGCERRFLRATLEFALGGLLGSAPYWLELLLVPGLAGACLNALRELAHRGTNIPYPWPWPWTVAWTNTTDTTWLFDATRVLAFLIPFVALGAGTLALLRTRREDLPARPLVAASVCVGLPYLHHVIARSDMAHLAQAIHPELLLLVALPRHALPRALTAGGLMLFSALVAVKHHPQLWAFDPWRTPPAYVEHAVAGETLRLKESQAYYLEAVESTLREHVRPEDEIFVAPSRPAFYALFDKRSPVRSIYMFWYATEAEELQVQRSLEERAVPWVFLIDTSVDERDDLRFTNTYPDVMRYLAKRYEHVPTPLLPHGHVLLRRRDAPRGR